MLVLILFIITAFIVVYGLIDVFIQISKIKNDCLDHDWHKPYSGTYKCKKCGVVKMKWESKS